MNGKKVFFLLIFLFSVSTAIYSFKWDIFPLLVSFFILIYFFYKFNAGSFNKSNLDNFPFKYKKKQFLLSKKELSFYNFLRDNISDKYSIMCSVRLIDVIEPVDKRDYTAKAKIIQKHIDFLIVTSWYLNPVLAIELNDSSHRDSKRFERDNFLDLAFQTAWLPLIFVSTRDLSKKEYLKKLLSEFIELS